MHTKLAGSIEFTNIWKKFGMPSMLGHLFLIHWATSCPDAEYRRGSRMRDRANLHNLVRRKLLHRKLV